ncbi:MAG: PIN domain-containing protein [Bryobacteraceae bacterium]
MERVEKFGQVIYLDTHVVGWLYGGELQKISKLAWDEINRGAPAISPIVILELQYLFEVGRAKAPASRVLETLSRDMGLSVCGLPFGQVIESALSEKWTRDPFDRLIVAHASANDAPLITKDEKIRRHYKRAIW